MRIENRRLKDYRVVFRSKDIEMTLRAFDAKDAEYMALHEMYDNEHRCDIQSVEVTEAAK